MSCPTPLPFSRGKDCHHISIGASLCALPRPEAGQHSRRRVAASRWWWTGSAPAPPLPLLRSRSAQPPLTAYGKGPEPLNFSRWSPPLPPSFSFSLLLSCVAWGFAWLAKALPCCGQPLMAAPGAGGRGGRREGCRLVWVYSVGFLWIEVVKIKIKK